MNEAAAANFFLQVRELWLDPEIKQRQENGRLAENFILQQCLIMFLRNRSPIVKLNDEIRWDTTVKLSEPQTISKGDPIALSEIERIESVKRPTVDGVSVAFIFLVRVGNSFKIIFDFTPNIPKEWEQPQHDAAIEPLMTGFLQDLLIEEVVSYHQAFEQPLSAIGLWPIPCLLPYPLSRIVALVQSEQPEEARALLTQHCNPDFLDGLSCDWWNAAPFNSRKQLIEDALAAHRSGGYPLCIHALVPQIEGVITDWIYQNISDANQVPFRAESKARKFGDLLIEEPLSYDAYDRIVKAVVSFIADGPVLQTFNTWLQDIDLAFPSRHVVGHGRYDASLFTEENAIKLVLLLDTIYRVISRHISRNSGLDNQDSLEDNESE